MPADDASRTVELPRGARPTGSLGPHPSDVCGIAWSPDGRLLAAATLDGAALVWDIQTHELRHQLTCQQRAFEVAFDSSGSTVASVGEFGALTLWDMVSGNRTHEVGGPTAVAFGPQPGLMATAEDDDIARLWNVGDELVLFHELDATGHDVACVAFDDNGLLVTAGRDGSIKGWTLDGELVVAFESHTDTIHSITFAPGGVLASASDDRTIKLWDVGSGRLIRTLEGHTDAVVRLSFTGDGKVLASADESRDVWLWDPATGEPLTRFESLALPSSQRRWTTGLAFHPTRPWLAFVTDHGPHNDTITVVELDVDALLAYSRPTSVTYTSAKIVLLGDSGVGKTGLGWRLTHGEFIEHSSTHGQQFWLFDDLGTIRGDGAQCEAVLWDLAGQPDYRLIHALFIDDADVALLVFDPTRDDDPLRGVDYWLRQLGIGTSDQTPSQQGPREAILVAARADRGAARLTTEEIEAFCAHRGVRAFVRTSAATGTGLDDLLAEMRDAIAWENRPTTVTTETFKHIKTYVLGLKESIAAERLIISPCDLRSRLERDRVATGFTDHEMLSAVGHLSNHGYVSRLRTSKGETRILLAPDLLNNVAASIVLQARRSLKGLGSLEEQRLLAGEYHFPELDALTDSDRAVLLDSAVARFLINNVCFRQTDPLTSRVYLVFPELINLDKPTTYDDPPVEDGAAYTTIGAVENLYASLVVLLGFTTTFTRTNQWRDHAQYVVGDGLTCGFRVDGERAGELDFVLYFGLAVGPPIRTLFQSLFESFLARTNIRVRRHEAMICSNAHRLNPAVVREQIAKGSSRAFCPDCGVRVHIASEDTAIVLTGEESHDLRLERREIAKRSRFEQAVFRLKAYVTQDRVAAPSCFVSYAWGVPAHERWVEGLANDLVKAGIVVILDRWENARVGASVSRFVDRVATVDRTIVVGTPLYRAKYENRAPMGGYVLSAEADLVGTRMLGSEREKESILPVLLEGSVDESFPPMLRGRVHADFREPRRYEDPFFKVVLSLYAIPPQHAIVSEIDRLVG